MTRLRSSREVEGYYAGLCKAHGEACPRCAERHWYELKDSRRRCSSCKYTFHAFSGRFINRCKLSLEHWQLVVRLFADGVTAQETAEDLSLAYDTVQKAFHTIRLSILHHVAPCKDIFTHRGELIHFCPNLDNEDQQTLCEGCLSYVFALSPDEKPVRLRLVPDLKAREVLAAPIPKKKWRNFIHTDRVNGHGALVFSCCKRGREIHQGSFTDNATWLDQSGDFKPFADRWFARYRAFKPVAYPLYLAEAILRHGTDGKRLIHAMETYLCAPVPKHREKKMP